VQPAQGVSRKHSQTEGLKNQGRMSLGNWQGSNIDGHIQITRVSRTIEV